jgi:hypothetical protein
MNKPKIRNGIISKVIITELLKLQAKFVSCKRFHDFMVCHVSYIRVKYSMLIAIIIAGFLNFVYLSEF